MSQNNEKTPERDVLAIRDTLETLLAVETLEYHNKAWLAGDNKTRNEAKRRLIQTALTRVPGTSKEIQ